MVQALAFFALSTLVSGAISYLFPSEGPRLKDLSISSSSYGNIIPEVFGSVRVAGDMIWSTGIKERKKKKKAGVGSYYNEYTYYGNFAMAFCKGPAQLRRIWANGKLIYDATGVSVTPTNGKYLMRFAKGDEDQLPDPMIQADKGAANTPAYRGLAVCIFENFALADYGNQIPQMAAEVYVGANSALAYTLLVPATDLTLTNASPGNDPWNTCVDFDRGYIYLPTVINWAPGHFSDSGIRRFRLSDGVEDRQILLPEMGLAGADYDGAFGGLYGVAADGSLIVKPGLSAFFTSYATLDPYSYHRVAEIGFNGNFEQPPKIHIPISNERFWHRLVLHLFRLSCTWSG